MSRRATLPTCPRPRPRPTSPPPLLDPLAVANQPRPAPAGLGVDISCGDDVPVRAVLAGRPGGGGDRRKLGHRQGDRDGAGPAGACVVIVARREAELAVTVDELTAAGCRADWVSADLSSR